MMKNILRELVIVCVSILCILTMITINPVEAKENVKADEKIKAVVMKSDGVEIGIVADESAGNNALNKIRDIYIYTCNIDNIKDITVNNKIVYEKITCNKEDVLSESEISNKIIGYNNTNDNNLISFTVIKENQVRYIQKTNSSQVAFTPLSRGSAQINREVFLHNSVTTPIKGILTSTFGENREGYYHKGIDLAANTGTKIQAALDGKVSFSGIADGYGKVVIIDHSDNLQTVYAHCSKLNVSKGDQVLRGQVIAEVGNTGDSTGPHLHFEIRVDGVPIDPLGYTGITEY
ncbi:M23 family metallopeptidase [Clostridium subterminale]|uniref:M23 family metallopeptidase n=1 Tax=Clostridium subterminale TaxID=1550 RepID=A0ABN1KMV3_CLOSU